MRDKTEITHFRTPRGFEPSAEPLQPYETVISETRHADTVQLTIADPLFEQPYTIGDGSVMEPAVEEVVLAYWQHNARQLSTRQLTNTQPFTTKTGTDTWSRLPHELSTAVITARFGGSQQQILEAATHDAAHRKSSHLVDDLLGPRGLENAHEGVDDYLRRTGFVAKLQQKGILDEQERFVRLNGLPFAAMCGYADKAPSFTNQSGKLGHMEAERLQYIGQEAAIWIYPLELVREAMGHAVRRSHKEHGDHVVFDDVDAARLFTKAQIRCHTEHWNDPVNDVIDELVMTLDRRLLTSRNHIHMIGEEYLDYHPGDVLHVAEEDHYAKYLALAEKDAFTSAILKITLKLAEQQRDVHASYEKDDDYKGPILPAWLQFPDALTLGTESRESQMLHKIPGTSKLVAEMMPGKDRFIDPFVVSGRGLWRRLSDVTPDIETYREQQKRHVRTTAYDVVINAGHLALDLKSAEKHALLPGFKAIQENWPKALKRPPMPDELLAKQVAEAGAATRRRGALPVALAAKTRFAA